MDRKIILLICSVAWMIGFIQYALAQSQSSWSAFIAGIRHEALQQGIRPEVFDRAFRDIQQPHQKVMRYYNTQPEKRISFLKYRNTRAGQDRIALGRREYKKYRGILNEIGERFGVNPCFIVSLWGMETSYGRFMGSFPVIQSLATLAYQSNRKEFFRRELIYALHILNGDHVQLKDLKGEWAGATGQPQFLPSSWHNYAVDYTKDGHKDIWKSYPDVFASIANYLSQHGWRKNEPWAVVVKLPSHFDTHLLTREVTKPVSEWKAMGVRMSQGLSIDPNLSASIIEPDGGPAMMIFTNFKVIMKWNRSTYYAGAVGYMAEQICQRPL